VDKATDNADLCCRDHDTLLQKAVMIPLRQKNARILSSRVLLPCLIALCVVLGPGWSDAADLSAGQAQKLLRVGLELSEKTHYLEALDLLEEARDILEREEITQTALYGDVLYSLAETRIKGRLHQSFPAQYVKLALKEAQHANKVRERLRDLPPRKFAEGYFVEGYIQKKFFKRTSEALVCFEKAVSIDPGFAAAKRELGELILSRDPKKAEN
jgi:tetratricopeptide (TPR) repeat protein